MVQGGGFWRSVPASRHSFYWCENFWTGILLVENKRKVLLTGHKEGSRNNNCPSRQYFSTKEQSRPKPKWNKPRALPKEQTWRQKNLLHFPKEQHNAWSQDLLRFHSYREPSPSFHTSLAWSICFLKKPRFKMGTWRLITVTLEKEDFLIWHLWGLSTWQDFTKYWWTATVNNISANQNGT